jgi:type I restriction enzyme S subunit
MGHIQRGHLKEAVLAVPDMRFIEAVTPLMQSLLDRRINCALQARTLSSLRDTLLPRLISGKLRLPEAREQVEAAVA